MNRSCFKHNLTLLAAIVALLVAALSPGIAQEPTSTFSGRVVDADGNPIAGIFVGLKPARIIHNSENVRRVRRPRNISDAKRMRTISNYRNPWNQLQTDETDKAGQFSITDVSSGPSEVVVTSETQTQIQRMPHFEPDYEILSLKIGKMTFHQGVFGFRGTAFSLEPGAHIENVEVAARP